jgi:hypothetical protein
MLTDGEIAEGKDHVERLMRIIMTDATGDDTGRCIVAELSCWLAAAVISSFKAPEDRQRVFESFVHKIKALTASCVKERRRRDAL